MIYFGFVYCFFNKSNIQAKNHKKQKLFRNISFFCIDSLKKYVNLNLNSEQNDRRLVNGYEFFLILLSLDIFLLFCL